MWRERHGRFDVATLENDTLRVSVVPDYGAKIIDLTDKRTGRNWLVEGWPTEASGDDAVFGGVQAYGWDECFPTVAPCPGGPWGQDLRDHGALWGRPWRSVVGDGGITNTFDDARFAFTRRLALNGNRLTTHYRLENRTDHGLPYLWSAHPLLNLAPGEILRLPDTTGVAATYVSARGETWPSTSLSWPSAEIGHQQVDLDRVHAIDERFAAKLYGDGGVPDRAEVDGVDGRLCLRWQADALGIWLDYGGWPDPEPVHQVAIEPTTAPADDLQSAVRAGRHKVLMPGKPDEWWIELAFEAGSTDPG